MGTKVKGLLRGLRYISQIFDDAEKEPEMKIGLPTDVKHVAHIGWDGPSAETPSWMEGFKKPEEGHQSAPLSVGEAKKKHDDKWVSEDSSKRRDQPGVPKSTRRLSGKKKSSSSSGTSSPKEEKSRHSRRHHLKDSESSRLSRVGSAEADESPARGNQEIPKKSHARRKKSSKSKRDSSDSGSGFVTCGSGPESPIKSSNITQKDKKSSEAC